MVAALLAKTVRGGRAPDGVCAGLGRFIGAPSARWRGRSSRGRLLIGPCLNLHRDVFKHGRSGSLVPLAYRPIVAGDAVLFLFEEAGVGRCRCAWITVERPRQLQARGVGWSVFADRYRLGRGGGGFLVQKTARWCSAPSRSSLSGYCRIWGSSRFDWQSISTVSDRYVYLSMAGVALAVALAVRQHPWLIFGLAPALVALVVSDRAADSDVANSRNGWPRHNLAIKPRQLDGGTTTWP